jgi:hypothetical protein
VLRVVRVATGDAEQSLESTTCGVVTVERVRLRVIANFDDARSGRCVVLEHVESRSKLSIGSRRTRDTRRRLVLRSVGSRMTIPTGTTSRQGHRGRDGRRWYVTVSRLYRGNRKKSERCDETRCEQN